MQRYFNKDIHDYELIFELVSLLDMPSIYKTVRKLCYQVVLEDYSIRYCVTSNEFNEDLNQMKLGADFIVCTSLAELITEFDTVLDFEVLKASRNSFKVIPDFIYYNVIYIKESIYLNFSAELQARITSINNSDLDHYELERVNYWLNLL